MLIKHLYKFFNKVGIPWVKLVWNYYPDGVPHAYNLCGSFWWRDVMKLSDEYRSITSVTVSASDTVMFWADTWNDICPQNKFPRLYSHAIDPRMHVKEVMMVHDKTQLFHTPLSPQAHQKLLELEQILGGICIDPLVNDEWKTIWKDGIYTAARYYHHQFRHISCSKVYDWIWKRKCVLRIKVFAWLLVSDRLNTKDMLKRRNWKVTDVYHCVLCPGRVSEDWMHLFFDCNFSRRIWAYLQIDWSVGQTMEEKFYNAKKVSNLPCFTEIVIVTTWHIWKQRNNVIFDKVLPTFRSWKRAFVHELTMHVHRLKDRDDTILSKWIDNLV
jgi:hypothetical protein